MNFYTMELSQFLTKLKGLVKKVSKSSVQQIQSHTQTCHQLVVNLLREDEMLTSLNGQKLRLLAYEAILFLVEMMNSRDQQARSNAVEKNKIEGFLSEIYDTLASIKDLLRSLQINKNSSFLKGSRNPNDQSNGLARFDRNLNQYQQRLGNILTEFEQKNQIKNPPNQPFQNSKHDYEDNDFLIQQMRRIIEKKEKRISQLTKLLQEAEYEKIDIEILMKKTQNEMTQRNNELMEQIEEITVENKRIVEFYQNQKVNAQANRAKYIQGRMKIEQIVNQKLIGKFSECNNFDFNYKIQALTQQTICSAKTVKQNNPPSRKLSLEKAGSTKSFRRIGLGEENDSTLNEKRFKELNDKNEELYKFIYCQAVTIQELI